MQLITLHFVGNFKIGVLFLEMIGIAQKQCIYYIYNGGL